MKIGHVVLVLGVIIVGYLVFRNWSKIKGSVSSAAGV